MLAQIRSSNVCSFWSVHMKFTHAVFLGGCLAAVVLAGCSSGTLFPAPGSSPQGSSAPSTAPTQSPTPSPALSSLIFVEDFFEQAAAGEVTPPTSGQYIVTGQKTWQTTTRALVQNCPGSPAALLTITDADIASAVTAVNTAGERRAANAATKDLAGFFEACGYNQPNEMVLLDAIGRNIIIDAIDIPPSWSQASIDVQSLQTTWAQVRAEVVARPNSAAAVSAYDTDVSTIAADVLAKDQAKTLNDASTLQNDFDAMEVLF
jgi:hypothetical protein